jgi:NDP-sugar pyrophosphorylase family protein
MATGPGAFIQNDTLFSGQSLKGMFDVLEQHPDIDLVIGRTRINPLDSYKYGIPVHEQESNQQILRIRQFLEKPQSHQGMWASTGIVCWRDSQIASQWFEEHDDIGGDLLPYMVAADEFNIASYPIEEWQNIGSLEDYFQTTLRGLFAEQVEQMPSYVRHDVAHNCTRVETSSGVTYVRGIGRDSRPNRYASRVIELINDRSIHPVGVNYVNGYLEINTNNPPNSDNPLVLNQSIIGGHVVVSGGSYLERCNVLPGAYLGQVEAETSIVGSATMVGDGSQLLSSVVGHASHLEQATLLNTVVGSGYKLPSGETVNNQRLGVDGGWRETLITTERWLRTVGR